MLLRCHLLLSRLLADGQLPRVTRQSANNKIDNKVKQGFTQISWHIHLMAEENLGMPQLGDSLKKVVRPFFAPNEVLYLQMRGIFAQRVKRGRRKERIFSPSLPVWSCIVMLHQYFPSICQCWIYFNKNTMNLFTLFRIQLGIVILSIWNKFKVYYSTRHTFFFSF